MDGKDAGSSRDERAAELGRKAARLLKRSRPRIQRLVEENRPRVERAGKQALHFAQEHEDEIKRAALKGVRMRAGPLGMAIDALGSQMASARSEDAMATCANCKAGNVRSAKFCNQCGASLNK